MSKLRSAFFGTPAIAVPALRALYDTTELVAAVCQPDRRAGRGLTLSEPAVKQAARELGIEVHQPVKVKTGNLDTWLVERDIELVVVLAYGRILPAPVLHAPRHGCMNLHASLLPKYRGAAPINWCIVHGETETGVSLMQMDEGLDTGAVYSKHPLSIGPDETAGELAERIAELCAKVVREDLLRAVAGELTAVPQDEAQASFAPPIGPEHTEIDWSRSAEDIVNLVRGMAPRPGAHSVVRGKRLRIGRARVSSQTALGEPGQVALGIGREILVATGAGTVQIERAQLEGRKELGPVELLNGRALGPSDRLGRG